MHYSQADTTAAGTVRSVVNSLVETANVAVTGQPPRFSLHLEQVEDKSLKSIQYITPGIVGYAIALGATLRCRLDAGDVAAEADPAAPDAVPGEGVHGDRGPKRT